LIVDHKTRRKITMPSPRVRKTRRRLRNQTSVAVPVVAPTAKVEPVAKAPIVKKAHKPKTTTKKDNVTKKSD
jgi:hypothetical protein